MTAGRPLYFRLLRIRRLRARPLTTFLLFEGSIVLGVLLALAEIVSWWGMLAIPITVAIMVKLHDAVAVAVAKDSGIGPIGPADVPGFGTAELRGSGGGGRRAVIGVAAVPVQGRAQAAGGSTRRPSPGPRDAGAEVKLDTTMTRRPQGAGGSVEEG